MSTLTIEQDITSLEREYWDALRNRDLATAKKLTDDPCIVTGPQGAATIDQKQFAQMFESETWTLNDYELQDVQVREVSDDVAVIAYKVTEQMTVEGKPLTLEAADASTWVRRDGRWLCVLHTESLLGDPFGRDRKR
jgi:ketosteroid isomerase-like protein